MKTNGSLGSTIRLLAGIVYGSLVASEVLAFLVMLLSAMLALTNEEFEALLYVVLGLIPFVFVLIVLSFLYVLAIGFAQVVDDVHAMREHTVPSEAAPKEATPTATANRYFGTAPTQKKPSAKEPPAPKSAPAVEVASKYFGADTDTPDARIFCPYCGKTTVLNEENRCEYCKREVHVSVPPRKTVPKTPAKHDDEPRQADCPQDKWFCKACGAQVALSEDRCECGYKRPKTR